MDWVSFITGSIGTAFALILFTSDREDDEDDEMEFDEDDEFESELIVNGHTGRNVTLSCQTCRKLKKHKEVKLDLYQCVKCKRHVDLRRKSS